jgi:hypothetical protein
VSNLSEAERINYARAAGKIVVLLRGLDRLNPSHATLLQKLENGLREIEGMNGAS